MKTEDLKEQGLTEDQIKFVMAENGKDLKKLQKDRDTLESDRDNWKGKAETAEETLKSFDGVDLKKINAELASWKKKAVDAEKEYQKKIYDRDFSDTMKTEMENYKFSSESARKAVMAEIMEAGLKLKDGKILGLSDLVSQIREKDASAFLDEKQQHMEQNRAKFTAPIKGSAGGQGGKYTMSEIMKMANEGVDVSQYMNGTGGN